MMSMTLEIIAAIIAKGKTMSINHIFTLAAVWAPWWSSSSFWDSLRAQLVCGRETAPLPFNAPVCQNGNENNKPKASPLKAFIS